MVFCPRWQAKVTYRTDTGPVDVLHDLEEIGDLQHRLMKIRVDLIFPPIPIRDFDWSAIDEDTYDGAPDSRNRHQIGYGRTREAAIEDLMAIIADND